MRRIGLALPLALGTLACAHGEPDIAVLSSNSDQLIWEAGQKAFQKKQWENARKHFKRIIDGFPQSEHGPSARLDLAEAYFQEGGTGNYILAIASFREFLTLYPSHPRSDYAQFQVAEGYYRQRNKPDRDQTNTERALAEYQRLLEIYPASANGETARERIRECRQSLAHAEFLAGYFYQRTRSAYRAAAIRYEGVLADYPDYQGVDEVLLRLGETLSASGRNAEALPHLSRLLAEYPASKHTNEARKLVDEIKQILSAPPPPPMPAPSPSPAPGPTV